MNEPSSPSPTSPAPAAQPATAPAAGTSRPWLARSVVLVCLLATLAMVSAVGYRWYRVRFPDTAIYIRGQQGYEGARLTISSDNGNTVYTGTLAAASGLRAAVLVEEGYYRILIEPKDQPVVREQVYVPQGGVSLWLNPAPSTQPADEAAGQSAADVPRLNEPIPSPA